MNQVEDLPTLIRRAFLLSQTAPTGPVMVSIPVDVLEEELDEPLPARTEVRGLGVSGGRRGAGRGAARLGAPAIVAGGDIGRAGAVDDLVGLAEALGATVFHEPMYDAVDFPATHPLSGGMLPPVDALIGEKLSGHDVVFLVGSHAFSAHYYTDATPIPERTRILQLDEDRAELGRNYPAEVALHGGISSTIRAIAGSSAAAARRPRPGSRRRRRPGPMRRPRAPRKPAASGWIRPRPPMRWSPACPTAPSCCEEAITTGLEVRRAFAASRPGSYHHSVGGALGWALGAGIGVKMARPERSGRLRGRRRDRDVHDPGPLVGGPLRRAPSSSW